MAVAISGRGSSSPLTRPPPQTRPPPSEQIPLSDQTPISPLSRHPTQEEDPQEGDSSPQEGAQEGDLPIVDRMTDACENITFPHTLYTVGNNVNITNFVRLWKNRMGKVRSFMNAVLPMIDAAF